MALMTTPVLEHLVGLIERVTFHNAETGFAVMQVKVRGMHDLVSVLGTLPEVQAGEWIDAEGKWIIDQQYGRQFRATNLRTSPPNTTEGMTKYLASGLIKGIGPALAGRLVDKFKMEVFEVIEKQSVRLLEVDGIGKGRQAKITEAWHGQKVVREIMVFLHSHGVSTSRAFRIYKTYGDDSIGKVQEDPYRLARDIWGIGFKTADQIAEKLGISKQSELRARAGVEYVLQELTEDGHCAYPHAALVEMAQKMLEIPPEIIETALAHGIAERRMVEGKDAKDTPLVYLAAHEASERLLAENLIALARGQHPCPPVDIPKAIQWVEGRIGFSLAAAQKEALAAAVKSKVMVITGGPGVGKTTLVNSIVQILKAKKLKVVLCAPTGRAAKRMSETTGEEAKTIHRLLEFDPAKGGFKRQKENPLTGHVFIVDETSMVDLMLAHQFVRAVPPNGALILVGDVDQLPSVGPGSVLRDIIDSGVVPVCRLTEVYPSMPHRRSVLRAQAMQTLLHKSKESSMGMNGRWDSFTTFVGRLLFFFVYKVLPALLFAVLVTAVCIGLLLGFACFLDASPRTKGYVVEFVVMYVASWIAMLGGFGATSMVSTTSWDSIGRYAGTHWSFVPTGQPVSSGMESLGGCGMFLVSILIPPPLFGYYLLTRWWLGNDEIMNVWAAIAKLVF